MLQRASKLDTLGIDLFSTEDFGPFKIFNRSLNFQIY